MELYHLEEYTISAWQKASLQQKKRKEKYNISTYTLLDQKRLLRDDIQTARVEQFRVNHKMFKINKMNFENVAENAPR